MSSTLSNIRKALDITLKEKWRDVIKDKYLKQKKYDDHYTFGLCYAASEALFHLSDKGISDMPHYKPCVGRIGDNTHWWLTDRKTGAIEDITATQFKSIKLRNQFYKAGRGSGFLTKQPSKAAQILIDHTLLVLHNQGTRSRK